MSIDHLPKDKPLIREVRGEGWAVDWPEDDASVSISAADPETEKALAYLIAGTLEMRAAAVECLKEGVAYYPGKRLRAAICNAEPRA